MIAYKQSHGCIIVVFYIQGNDRCKVNIYRISESRSLQVATWWYSTCLSTLLCLFLSSMQRDVQSKTVVSSNCTISPK